MSVVIEITWPDLVIEEGRLQSFSFKGCLSIWWNSLKNIRVLSLQKLVKFTSKPIPSWASWKTCCRLTSSLLSVYLGFYSHLVHTQIHNCADFFLDFSQSICILFFSKLVWEQRSVIQCFPSGHLFSSFSQFSLDYFKYLLLISESKFKFFI